MRGHWYAFATAALSIVAAVQAATPPAPQAPQGISTIKTAVGHTFVESRGMTLYYYDLDQISPGESSCTGDCATAWPPLAAGADAQPLGEWKIIQRDDGTRQWAYQNKPLYLFTGDAAPGDVKGDGLQRFWHAAKYMLPAPMIVRPSGVKIVRAGKDYVLADHQERPLYGRSGRQPCKVDCAGYSRFAAPALAQAPGDWKVVTDSSGFRQWSYQGQPLYRFEGDTKPGERAGESNAGWLAVVVE